MNKPRILLTIHYLEIGGAETSLIGLLQALDYCKVEVDLFVYSHKGPLMKLIPPQVNLLPESRKYTITEMPISDVLRMGYIDVALARLLAKFKYRLFRQKNKSELPEDMGLYQYMANHVAPLLPNINPEITYDLAVNLCGMQNVVLDKVKAKKKVAWIHTDYSKVDTDRNVDLSMWSRFDTIISISDDVSRTFCEVFPSLSPKLTIIENILSPEFVRMRATSTELPGDMKREGNEIILLSVGRYSPAKNYENIPFILKKIIEKGVSNIRWYIIGYGDDSLIRHNIAKTGMENHVILLGKRENPYPYIESCDIYVQPSRFEGKSVTVREAQILGKPVIVTNYPTARSQIKHGIDGFIVPLENDTCAEAMSKLITDKNRLIELSENIKNHDFGNQREVEKFYDLIEYAK